jgi:hydrogenase expression/formation protein HypD
MSVIEPSHQSARFWLEKLQALPERDNTFRILNVCGGHERSIAHAGLRSLLPDWIELVPGPGCPVCVCSNEDLNAAIRLARQGKVLVAYGDMLRVPTQRRDSLQAAKADGADIRPVASPLDALDIALSLPDQQVVFFAAGFETSFAPLAAVLTQMPQPDNLYYLTAGKQTWPAVEKLLSEDHAHRLHGLIAPGHVATIMGAEQWRFCADDFKLPTAVCGFTSESLLQGVYWLLTTPEPGLHNAYPEVVNDQGNLRAQQQLLSAFDIVAGHWRGLGEIEQSAYQLAPIFTDRDARKLWPEVLISDELPNTMPKGCRCADVVMARALPSECPLFRQGCTPAAPQGPCMVSEEGACQIWFSQGQR